VVGSGSGIVGEQAAMKNASSATASHFE